jgi:plasmid stability protein
MTLTISLPDPLADQLLIRAQAERMSVDELASAVLTAAMQRPLDPDKWRVQNQRRLALIRKRFTSGLSTAEEQELRALQELADRQVEAMDRAMLLDVQTMKQTVEASLKDAG